MSIFRSSPPRTAHTRDRTSDDLTGPPVNAPWNHTGTSSVTGRPDQNHGNFCKKSPKAQALRVASVQTSGDRTPSSLRQLSQLGIPTLLLDNPAAVDRILPQRQGDANNSSALNKCSAPPNHSMSSSPSAGPASSTPPNASASDEHEDFPTEGAALTQPLPASDDRSTDSSALTQPPPAAELLPPSQWPPAQPQTPAFTPLSAAESLIQISPERRSAERYITALHALALVRGHGKHEHPVRTRHLDAYARDLCLNRRELGRLYCLHALANLPAQRLPMPRFYPRAFADVVMDLGPPLVPTRRAALEFHQARAAARARRGGTARSAATVREARDALASAAWDCLRKRNYVFAMLRGEETIAALREEGTFEDDVELEPLGDEDAGAEEAAALREDAFLAAVAELPEAGQLPTDVLRTVARRVEDFSVFLRQTPTFLRTTDTFGFLQRTTRFEQGPHRELNRISRVVQVWRSLGPGKVRRETVVKPRGPSRVAYEMAAHRLEALKWTSAMRMEEDVKVRRRRMRHQLERGIFKTTKISLHPDVWDLLLKTFSSAGELYEDLPTFENLAEVIGIRNHALLVRALRRHQTTLLLSGMKTVDKDIANTLVANFGSARRSLRASLVELERVYGNVEAAHEVSQYVHGYNRDLYRALVPRVRLPYFVARTTMDEYGDLPAAQQASFSAFLRTQPREDAGDGDENRSRYLTIDERFAAYQAVHEPGMDVSEDTWARFDASWNLLCKVCSSTNVSNCVAVTATLLDEEQYGANVLRRLALDEIGRTCLRSSELTVDDALKLKVFANSFIPSGRPSEATLRI